MSMKTVAAGIVALATLVGSETSGESTDPPLWMLIENQGRRVIVELVPSAATKDLVAQLPLQTTLKNYGSDEKIFYPPRPLGTHGVPLAQAKVGTLAYYAPWGDVALFYRDFGSASGLYHLDQVVSGAEHMANLEGPSNLTLLSSGNE